MSDNPSPTAWLSTEEREKMRTVGLRTCGNRVLDHCLEADRLLAGARENAESLYVQSGGGDEKLTDAQLYFRSSELIKALKAHLEYAQETLEATAKQNPITVCAGSQVALREHIVAAIPDSEDSLIKIRATCCHFVDAVLKVEVGAKEQEAEISRLGLIADMEIERAKTVDERNGVLFRRNIEQAAEIAEAKARQVESFGFYQDAVQQLNSSKADATRLREALALFYDKWENGTPCFEDPESCSGSLGNAFKLSYEEENEILGLLKNDEALAATPATKEEK